MDCDLQSQGGRKPLFLEATKEVTRNGLSPCHVSLVSPARVRAAGSPAGCSALPGRSERDLVTRFRDGLWLYQQGCFRSTQDPGAPADSLGARQRRRRWESNGGRRELGGCQPSCREAGGAVEPCCLEPHGNPSLPTSLVPIAPTIQRFKERRPVKEVIGI